METKLLERASLVPAALYAFACFIPAFLLFAFAQWYITKQGHELHLTALVFASMVGSLVTDCWYSKHHFTGVLIAGAESLGITAAICSILWPLQPSEIFVVFVALGSVYYASSFIRIMRLKKEGYIEK